MCNPWTLVNIPPDILDPSFFVEEIWVRLEQQAWGYTGSVERGGHRSLVHCAISNGSLLENNSPTYNGEQYILKVCLLCIMMLVLESTTVLCTSGPLYSIQFAFIVRGGGTLSPLPPPTQATLKVAYHLVRSNNFHVGVYMPLRLPILKAHPHSPITSIKCVHFVLK